MARAAEIPLFNPAALMVLREQNHLSQAGLARLLEVPKSLPHRWETGRTLISAKDLRLLARTLQVSPARLQHPLPLNPTLADLRTHIALTVDETATRLRMKASRLLTWETGVLGSPNERGALLAAIIAVSPAQIVSYDRTGVLPRPVARRLAPVLRVGIDEAIAAFGASRLLHQDQHAVAGS